MRSSLEERIYKLLKKLFPAAKIKMQEYVRFKGHRLFLDFYIPALDLVVEVDGLQHDSFNSFFHEGMGNFYWGYRQDRLKEEWAREKNKIFLRLKEKDIKEIDERELWRRINLAQKEANRDF